MEEPLLILHGTTNLWIDGERQQIQKFLHNNIRDFAEKCQQEVEWLNEFLKNIVPKKNDKQKEEKAAAQRREEAQKKREEERNRKLNILRELRQKEETVASFKRKRNEEQQSLIESKRKVERSKLITYTDKKTPISTKSSSIPRKTIINVSSRQPQQPQPQQRESKRLRTAEFDDDTAAIVLDQNNHKPLHQEFSLVERLRQEAQVLRQKAFEKEEEARQQSPKNENSQKVFTKRVTSLSNVLENESDDSSKGEKITTRSKSKQDWCNGPEISAALARQAQIDPDT
ncbi:617_t:CDS:2, partial [Ambispora gerdemannii]